MVSGRESKNAAIASPAVACAGVNTADVPQRERSDMPDGWPGLANSHAAVAMVTSNRNASAQFGQAPATLRFRNATETAHVVDEVPGVRVGDFALEALHVVLGRRAVLDHPEDFAFA